MAILNFPYRAARRATKKLKEFLLSYRFKHIYGPRKVFLEKDQVCLVLVGRNNACFLDENIRRHREKGVCHIVYVDNESSDDSINIVKSHPKTTIFSTDLSFYHHQNLIRNFAVSRIADGGWVLAIDCDEIFDYVGSNKIKISELVRRLARQGYTCLVAQMLDLVPNCILEDAGKFDFSEAIDHFSNYSLQKIQAEDYTEPTAQLAYFLSQNNSSHQGVKILYGGLRKVAFGENCCLTKHPLFQVGAGVTPFAHPHVSTGLNCADFTALLKHYKFACGVINRENKLIEERRMANGEIELRVQFYKSTNSINLASLADNKKPTPEKLVKEGFLFFSDRAKQEYGVS